MKKNDKDQIMSAAPAELLKKSTELMKQISDEILKRQNGNVKNVHTVKTLRRKLAVVLSVKRAHELAQKG